MWFFWLLIIYILFFSGCGDPAYYVRHTPEKSRCMKMAITLDQYRRSATYEETRIVIRNWQRCIDHEMAERARR